MFVLDIGMNKPSTQVVASVVGFAGDEPQQRRYLGEIADLHSAIVRSGSMAMVACGRNVSKRSPSLVVL